MASSAEEDLPTRESKKKPRDKKDDVEKKKKKKAKKHRVSKESKRKKSKRDASDEEGESEANASSEVENDSDEMARKSTRRKSRVSKINMDGSVSYFAEENTTPAPTATGNQTSKQEPTAVTIAREKIQRKVQRRREKYSKEPPKRTTSKDELDIASKQQIEILYGSIKFGTNDGQLGGTTSADASLYDSLADFDTGGLSPSNARRELPDSFFDSNDTDDGEIGGTPSSPKYDVETSQVKDAESSDVVQTDPNMRADLEDSVDSTSDSSTSSADPLGENTANEEPENMRSNHAVDIKTADTVVVDSDRTKQGTEAHKTTNREPPDDIVKALKRSIQNSPKTAKRRSVDVEGRNFPVEQVNFLRRTEGARSGEVDTSQRSNASSAVSIGVISEVTYDDTIRPEAKYINQKPKSAGTVSTKDVSTSTVAPVKVALPENHDGGRRVKILRDDGTTPSYREQPSKESYPESLGRIPRGDVTDVRPKQTREERRLQGEKPQMGSDVKNQRCGWWITTLMVFFLIAIGVVVFLLYRLDVIEFNNSKHDERNVNSAPTAMPSQLVTQQPTSAMFSVIASAVLAEFGDESFSRLEDQDSPQANAARWISDVDETLTFPLDEESSVRFRQRYGLATFYFSSGHESWAADLNFLSDSHECSWNNEITSQGVACSDGLLITEINLPSHNLVGSIPQEFGSLSSLERLVLDDNDITGPLPEEIYQLTNLRELSLVSNGLSGSLSGSIARLSKLESLLINKSKMTGTLPAELGDLSRLQTVVLSKSSFEGSIPIGIRSLFSLSILDLSDNFLSGTIPQRIADLPLLRKLDMSLNKLTGSLPNGNFASLEELAMDSNRLTGSIPTFVLVPSLTSLNLRNNKFSGRLPTNWLTAPLLRMIDISVNTLSGSLPPTLGSLFDLTSLYAADCGLTGTLPPEIGNTLLEELDVEGNFLDGSVPPSFAQLPLDYFAIGRNSITGNIGFLCDLPSAPFLSADCAEQVQCWCCSRCFNEDNEETMTNNFGNF